MLEALELIRETTPKLGPVDQIALLYVAENPGISIAELAHVARVNMMAASRIARRLSGQPDGEGAGLVDIRPNPADARGLMLFLTRQGQALCASIDRSIDAGVKIDFGQLAEVRGK